jgi:hypothetical protein
MEKKEKKVGDGVKFDRIRRITGNPARKPVN